MKELLTQKFLEFFLHVPTKILVSLLWYEDTALNTWTRAHCVSHTECRFGQSHSLWLISTSVKCVYDGRTSFCCD